MPALVHHLRKLGRETCGAEIAEAAAVLPLMFLVLLGIFWFGQAFSIYGALTRAAQDGARAGSLPYCVTCTAANTPAANAVTAAENDLLAAKLDPTLARYPSPAPSLVSCTDENTAVTCDSTASPANFCVQTRVQLTPTARGASGLCGVSVSMRYPYRFWLPFTSINKQTIWITASSRMRMENQ
jgi:Flp pilus assembly protein TadG